MSLQRAEVFNTPTSLREKAQVLRMTYQDFRPVLPTSGHLSCLISVTFPFIHSALDSLCPPSFNMLNLVPHLGLCPCCPFRSEYSSSRYLTPSGFLVSTWIPPEGLPWPHCFRHNPLPVWISKEWEGGGLSPHWPRVWCSLMFYHLVTEWSGTRDLRGQQRGERV